jgi:glutamate N-acetyltransferase / amino-acid N-acetyltransferase
MSVTYPKGFRAAATAAGMKPSGTPDLALLVGDSGTTAAGLFTTNRAQAAPVLLASSRLTASAGGASAVLVNSGQANAATGARGVADAEKTTVAAADLLGLPADRVLPCSTGVIGEPLHVEAILGALPSVVSALTSDGGEAFARAIMTTDTVPKSASADAGGHRVGGAAKGVGMIAPSLATMLAFVTTDARIDAHELDRLARTELQPRFESLTVDACPSTNDTVLLFASGAAGLDPVAPGSAAWDELAAAVGAVGDGLCAQLIGDAEGVEHVLILDVEGARTDQQARTVAKAVAESPLVKTALFGEDPNPGRLLQAVGASGVEVDVASVDAWIGGTQLIASGVIPPAYFEGDGLRAAASAAMAAREVHVRIGVGDGAGRSRVLGCDLTYGYVRINGEYTT